MKGIPKYPSLEGKRGSDLHLLHERGAPRLPTERPQICPVKSCQIYISHIISPRLPNERVHIYPVKPCQIYISHIISPDYPTQKGTHISGKAMTNLYQPYHITPTTYREATNMSGRVTRSLYQPYQFTFLYMSTTMQSWRQTLRIGKALRRHGFEAMGNGISPKFLITCCQ